MSNKLDFGTFGSASYTEMEIEEQDVYAKYPASVLCPSGGAFNAGADFSDDGGCTALSGLDPLDP